MAKKKKDDSGIKVVADNRKARHNFAIEDSLEAGIELHGTEVKALRTGKATIGDSYAQAKGGEITLVNLYIPEYEAGNRFNHEPRRPRKLLLHKREIAKLSMAVQREGMTLIPLKLYFNQKGRAKIQLGVARGKKLHDKRASEKAKDWARDKGRLLRAKG
jgi:SsrA-binding protein